jgi:hypothetical protein
MTTAAMSLAVSIQLSSKNMRTASIYGAYNARWLTPQEIAKTFVPLPQYRTLTQTHNSLLMGPRGCGKTTLLKMLTVEAGRSYELRLDKEPELANQAPLPDFTAIYIPSDTRWAYELVSFERVLGQFPTSAMRAQRAMVSISALSEVISVFDLLLEAEPHLNHEVAKALIDEWSERRIVPTLLNLRTRVQSHAAAIRSALNSGVRSNVEDRLDSLPPSWTAHPVDPIVQACEIFESVVPRKLRPPRWGLCFDEIETSPNWLQNELLASLRSVQQRYLLKLTWAPVIPEQLQSAKTGPPTERQDFTPIPLWQSHVGDARQFSVALTTKILKDRLRSDDVTPGVMFGRSLFASEELDSAGTYRRGAEIWERVSRLAKKDESFAAYLAKHGLTPNDPYTDDTKTMAEAIRKVKPIVLLRDAWLDDEKHVRSRKNTSLYAGEDAIYAMSDGNPRWLAGVVNELVDAYQNRGQARGVPLLSADVQDEVLTAASWRMRTLVKHNPADLARKMNVYELVEQLGRVCKEQVLGERFTDEPVGSFEVDSRIPQRVALVVERGLLTGAFIYVMRTPHDGVGFVKGARLRLSFMLAPSFGLLFRNYRWISLSTALSERFAAQSRIPFDEDLE